MRRGDRYPLRELVSVRREGVAEDGAVAADAERADCIRRELRVFDIAIEDMDCIAASMDCIAAANFWQNFGKMLLVFGCIGADFCK